MYFSRASDFEEQVLPFQCHLLLDGLHFRRHQAEQTEALPLLVRKGRTLIVHRVAQELRAFTGRLHYGRMSDQRLHTCLWDQRECRDWASPTHSLQPDRSLATGQPQCITTDRDPSGERFAGLIAFPSAVPMHPNRSAAPGGVHGTIHGSRTRTRSSAPGRGTFFSWSQYGEILHRFATIPGNTSTMRSTSSSVL
jgi:hypothetical protein